MSTVFVQDQFEVENDSVYYKSYTDHIITGSLPLRAVVGSLVTGSKEVYGQVNKDIYTYFSHYPNRTLGMTHRFTQHMSVNERYYDTVLPRYDKIVELNGGGIIAPGSTLDINNTALTTTADYVKIPLMLSPASRGHCCTDSPFSFVADGFWMFDTSPFQNKYSSIERTLKQSKIAPKVSYRELDTGTNLIYYTALSSSTKTTNRCALEFVYYFGPTAINPLTLINMPGFCVISPGWPPAYNDPLTTIEGSTTDFLKGFFGLHPTASFITGPKPPTWFATTITSSTNVGFAMGLEIEGWRYGIFNAFPVNSRAIYRTGKYGQLADKLEQRLYTKFYDLIGYNDDGTLSYRVGPTTSVVTVNFVSGTMSYVSASNPLTYNTRNSAILDREYRSSLPFFEIDRLD